jgi:hypothetical protein
VRWSWPGVLLGVLGEMRVSTISDPHPVHDGVVYGCTFECETNPAIASPTKAGALKRLSVTRCVPKAAYR